MLRVSIIVTPPQTKLVHLGTYRITKISPCTIYVVSTEGHDGREIFCVRTENIENIPTYEQFLIPTFRLRKFE